MLALAYEPPLAASFFCTPAQAATTWLLKPQLLERKGARLSSAEHIWYMLDVQGPDHSGGLEYFRIITHTQEELLVYRHQEDFGMKQLTLIAITQK